MATLLIADTPRAVWHGAQEIAHTLQVGLKVQRVSCRGSATPWREIAAADVLYVRCPPGSLEPWLEAWKRRGLATALIVEIPSATAEGVVAALRAGACDVLLQTPSQSELHEALDRAGLIPRGGVPLAQLLSRCALEESPLLGVPGRGLTELELRLRSPGASFDSIGRLISRDPALVRRVLHVANSPMWLEGRPVESLRQACVRLGVTQLGQIAKQELLRRAYQIEDPLFASLAQRMWINTLATASCARTLAVELSMDPDAAYDAALFHNVGEILILGLVAQTPVLERRQPDFRKRVVDTYVQEHAALGAEVLRKLGMSVGTVAVAAHHERPLHAAAAGAPPALVRLINLSWELATEAGFSYPRRGHGFSVKDLCAALGVSPTIARKIARRSFDGIQTL